MIDFYIEGAKNIGEGDKEVFENECASNGCLYFQTFVTRCNLFNGVTVSNNSWAFFHEMTSLVN